MPQAIGSSAMLAPHPLPSTSASRVDGDQAGVGWAVAAAQCPRRGGWRTPRCGRRMGRSVVMTPPATAARPRGGSWVFRGRRSHGKHGKHGHSGSRSSSPGTPCFPCFPADFKNPREPARQRPQTRYSASSSSCVVGTVFGRWTSPDFGSSCDGSPTSTRSQRCTPPSQAIAASAIGFRRRCRRRGSGRRRRRVVNQVASVRRPQRPRSAPRRPCRTDRCQPQRLGTGPHRGIAMPEPVAKSTTRQRSHRMIEYRASACPPAQAGRTAVAGRVRPVPPRSAARSA